MIVVGLIIGLAATLGKSASHVAVLPTQPAASASPAASAPPSVPAGYAQFQDTADNLSISVPSQWRKIDLTSLGTAQALQQFEAANPALKGFLGTDLASSGVKFLALSNTEPATINIVAKPSPGLQDSDLAAGLPTLKARYQQMGITVVSSQTTPLANHQAVEIDADFTYTDSTGATVSRPVKQYFLAANDLLYVVTLNGNSADFPTILQTLSVS